MSQTHSDVTHTIDYKTASENYYDAVIVGAGISGAIVAKELAQKGYKVLILEAGPGKDLSMAGYQTYVNNFYTAVSKDNNAPFLRNPNAPMARSNDARRLQLGQPNTGSYIVQNGPSITDSSYSRVVGGTTMHWEAKTPRMLREDFEMRTRFGVGLDWPLKLDAWMPYYRKAEHEIGISGDVKGQKEIGVEFANGYVFPMHELPASYLDKEVAKYVDGTEVELDDESYKIKITTYPQGRNGIPNDRYKAFNKGKNFVPVGAVSHHQAEEGERCQGNTNCTPICPVQAKYDARKTLAKALNTRNVHLLPQAVASKVYIDQISGQVSKIEFKAYKDLTSSEHITASVKGRIFILTANAIENARLMLASGLNSTSDMMGRHLMDHPYLLAWGLMPEVAGTMRGTSCTSGISNLRKGSFRSKQAAFAVDIHNDGWGWATGAPYTNLLNIVDNMNKYGADLRHELVHQISKQLLLAFMVEMPPEPNNRVTVDPNYTDQLGNLRPVLSYTIPDYSLNGIAYAREFSKRVFQRIGAEDFTSYDPLDYGYVNYNGQGYAIRGGNHLAGTHVMGTNSSNSVVDANQKSWDHKNLYLIGPGSMPTIGTSNTTLTVAAMCFKSTEAILKDLKKK